MFCCLLFVDWFTQRHYYIRTTMKLSHSHFPWRTQKKYGMNWNERPHLNICVGIKSIFKLFEMHLKIPKRFGHGNWWQSYVGILNWRPLGVFQSCAIFIAEHFNSSTHHKNQNDRNCFTKRSKAFRLEYFMLAQFHAANESNWNWNWNCNWHVVRIVHLLHRTVNTHMIQWGRKALTNHWSY